MERIDFRFKNGDTRLNAKNFNRLIDALNSAKVELEEKIGKEELANRLKEKEDKFRSKQTVNYQSIFGNGNIVFKKPSEELYAEICIPGTNMFPRVAGRRNITSSDILSWEEIERRPIKVKADNASTVAILVRLNDTQETECNIREHFAKDDEYILEYIDNKAYAYQYKKINFSYEQEE